LRRRGIRRIRPETNICADKPEEVRGVTSNSIDSRGNLVKNGGSKEFESSNAAYGGKVKNTRNERVLGIVGLLSAGLLMAGCKSAPDLTATQAQTLVQANYDQSPPVGVSITVFDLGMRQGVTAKYWDRAKAYPNNYWADFKLTDEGKKVVTLAKGGDVIQWRPDSPDDKKFSVVVTTVATNHLKARNVKDPQDEVGGTKSCVFNEVVPLDGVPAPLQDMAHNPGTRLSITRTATFTSDNGTWKLQSVN
jgi:hypothetical protein